MSQNIYHIGIRCQPICLNYRKVLCIYRVNVFNVAVYVKEGVCIVIWKGIQSKVFAGTAYTYYICTRRYANAWDEQPTSSHAFTRKTAIGWGGGKAFGWSNMANSAVVIMMIMMMVCRRSCVL